MKNLVNCNHEPDESTIEYDKKYGRKAICKKCGVKLFITRFIPIPEKKTETSKGRKA